jgi:hypothetical protein
MAARRLDPPTPPGATPGMPEWGRGADHGERYLAALPEAPGVPGVITQRWGATNPICGRPECGECDAVSCFSPARWIDT